MKDNNNGLPQETYRLVEGPLFKSIYTYQLEDIARQLMMNKSCLFTRENHEDYITIDNNKYNLTAIIKHANFEHIELNPDDFKLYTQHAITTNRPPYIISRLKPDNELLYRRELYQDYYLKNQVIPDPPISIEEMHAINIYTGGFFKKMNSLLRGTFDFESESPLHAQEAIIQSVMCASGLRKIPQTPIDEVYRGNSIPSEEEHQERIQAAKNHGVVQLSGFISSSTEKTSSFEHKPVDFQLTNLKGAYIAPISQQPHEKEFLIPPTQIQITDYVFEKNRHYFKARLVSDLAHEAIRNPDNNESQHNANTRIKIKHERSLMTPIEELRDRLKSLPLNKCNLVFKANKTLIKTPHDFARVLEVLLPEQRELIFNIMIKNNKLINMIKNTEDFIQVMMFLSPSQCKQVCIGMGKTLQDMKRQDMIVSKKLIRYLLPEQLVIINQSQDILAMDKLITTFQIKASIFINQAKNMPKFKQVASEIDALNQYLSVNWINKPILDRNPTELLNNDTLNTLLNSIELNVGRKTGLKNLPILRELNKWFKTLKDEITSEQKSINKTKDLKHRLGMLKEPEATPKITLKNRA